MKRWIIMKKIDTNIVASTNNGITIISYNPSFSDYNDNIRINSAILKLKINRVGNLQNGFAVYNASKELIDCISGDHSTGFTCLNITDELQDHLNYTNESFAIEIIGDSENYINVDPSQSSVIINYRSIKARQKSNSTHNAVAGRAGNGEVNLSLGSLLFAHEDVKSDGNVLPVQIGHIFNSTLKNLENDSVQLENGSVKIPSYACGKGWKLNVQQYLIQEKFDSSLLNNETAKKFTYIDEKGSHNIIEEKYFYKNENNEKVYIKTNEISIDVEKKLEISIGDKTYPVEKENNDKNGLSVISKFSGFIGLNYVKNQEDKIEQYKTQIEEVNSILEQNINTRDNLVLAINQLQESNARTLAQIALQEKSYALENEGLTYQNELAQINEERIDVLSKYNTAWANLASYKYTQINNDTEKNLQGPLNISQSALNNKDLTIAKKELKFMWGIGDGEEKVDGSVTKKISLLSENQEYIKESKAYIEQKEKEDIDNYNSQLQIINKNIEKNKEQKTIYEKELAALVDKLPVHYVVDADNNTLGFAPTDVENVFRLVAVVDKWENTIYINYDDEGNIESIIDGENNIISFEYDKKCNRLMSVKDARSRKVKFQYDDAGMLIGIYYPDSTFSTFSYVNGQLQTAVSPNGHGVLYTYNSDNKVAEIARIACTKEISNDKVVFYDESEADFYLNNAWYKKIEDLSIEYINYRSTIIKDEYGKTRTYLFDSLGKPLAIYENKFKSSDDIDDVEDNIFAKSFDYANDKAAFTISPLYYGEDYLKDAAFVNQEGQKVQAYKSAPAMENYLGGWLDGETAYGIDAPVLARYSVRTADDKYGNKFILSNTSNASRYISATLSQKAVEKIIASGKKDFVLSGWAKADSACVNRRHTDYCNQCGIDEVLDETEKIYYDCADNIQLNRRFELRAELQYADRTETQYVSFDWMQTDWQYCAVPVAISENPEDQLKGIKIFFDYSYNTGIAELCFISLKEGKWEYSEFNVEGNKTYYEDSSSKYVFTYEYKDKKLIKSIMQDKINYAKKVAGESSEVFITAYDYNYNGALVRSIDYNGIVIENEYNDKGVIVKTVQYHKNEPQTKFYDEKLLDDKGKETGAVNELGDKVCEYEYVPKTGIIASVIDIKGNKTAYGIDYNNDMSTGISASADSGANANIIGYNLGVMTALSHNNTTINFSYDGFGREQSIKIGGNVYSNTFYEEITEDLDADSGQSVKVKKGERKTISFGNGEIVTVEMNENGNETFIQHNGQLVAEKRYDSYGRFNSLHDYTLDGEAGYDIYLDNYDNETAKKYKGYGRDFAIENVFDDYGVQTQKAFVFGAVPKRNTKYIYSDTPDNRLSAVELPNGITQHITYDKNNRPTEIKAINSLKNIDSFLSKNIYYLQKGDHASNLVASEWFGTKGEIKENFKYAYDEKGNVVSVKENGRETIRYTYDELSRLIREDNLKLGKTYVITYDNGGNITMRCEYPYSLAAVECLSNGNQIIYGYAADGWRDRLTHFGSAICGNYDALGNPSLYRGKNLVWSHGRRLDSIGNVNYKYNADGIRISKTANGITTRFYSDGTTLLAQESDNIRLYFNYGIDGLCGFTYNDGAEYYYKRNMFGDVLAVLNADGVEIVKYAYDAWGNHNTYVLDGTEYIDATFEHQYTEEGQNNLAIARINPIRYRGYYFDTETGLYYLNTRYYDPQVGRFINADAISYAEPDKINGLNLYAYCVNNPIVYIDPNGNAIISILLGLLLALGIGAGVGAAAYTVSEVVSYAVTGRWSWSWGMFAGSVIGGAIGGLFSAFGAHAVVVGAIAGFVSVGAGMSFQNVLGETNYSGMEIVSRALVAGITGALLGGVTGLIKINGITSGRGSWQQISKQIFTKLFNQSIKRVSAKTLGKMYFLELIKSGLNILWDSIFND